MIEEAIAADNCSRIFAVATPQGTVAKRGFNEPSSESSLSKGQGLVGGGDLGL